MKKGSKHSEKTIQKMKESLKLRSHSIYENRKPHSKESRERQGQTMRLRYPAGKNHFNYGRHHSEVAKEKMSKAREGKYFRENNVQWRGGISKHVAGYIWILSPHHPYRGKRGYVLEHRLIIEAQIGRFLKPGEISHHINKIRNDNRPQNLMAFVSQSAHLKFEAGKEIAPEDIVFDGKFL